VSTFNDFIGGLLLSGAVLFMALFTKETVPSYLPMVLYLLLRIGSKLDQLLKEKP
jgi:hypothetical protein